MRHKICLFTAARTKALSKDVLCAPRGAYLVLQLHDELIYEVNITDLNRTARIVQSCMESAMKLSVKLPVKIKVGSTWGKLQEFTVQ